MQRHVPDDVWMCIAESIPQDNLKMLYPVNRAFFHAAINARYHTVLLRTLDIDTFKLIMRLQDEYVTKRVCRVEFQPLSFIYDCLKSPNQALQAFSKEVQQRNPRLIPHDFDWSDPVREIYRHIGKAVTHMRAVTSCTWAYASRDEWTIEPPPNFFDDLSLPFHHLEQLELHNPLVKKARRLKSTHFPRLRELSIHDTFRDHQDAYATNEPPVIGFLASFVSSFNPTLTRLKIFSTWKLFPSFFDKLGHFPQLTKLELSISTIDLSFTRFMVRHAETLKFLFLDVGGSVLPPDEVERILQTARDAFTPGPVFEFPRLQTLQLALPFCPSSKSMTLATCIRPFVGTLTTLILKEEGISTTDLEIILSAFSRNPDVLTSASLHLRQLSLQTVNLFANHCPGLTDLKLTVQVIMGVEDNSERGFYRDMEGCSYPQWPLRNITLKRSHYCDHFWSEDALCWRAMAVLARLVPSITSFNDQGDLNIPDGLAERTVLEEMRSDLLCTCRDYV